MSSNLAITFDKVSISLSKTPILFDMDLSIPEGIIYGLLGPSGAGKTTTVKIAAGILEGEPKENVLVLGSHMPSLDTMNDIGYMAQEEALYTDLTGLENIEFFGSLYGLKKDDLKERVKEALELVFLTDDKDKSVSKYSGGMKRRLSLAIAIVHEPKLLILDEPTVGIDPVLRQTLWNKLYDMAKNGTTILITTHVMDEAEKCHKLAMIRNGRVIGEGSPEELKNSQGVKTMEEVFLKLSETETQV